MKFMKIRGIAAIFAFLFVLVSCAAAIAETALSVLPDARKAVSIGEAFIDEELTYQIGMLIFDNAAIGHLSLKKGGGEDYLATLTAETFGMIDRIYHRKDTYIARLNMTNDGKRFITKTFEKIVDVNGRIRRGITYMDFEKGVMTWKSWGGGKPDGNGIVTFAPGVYYDDPLGAFYNFRYGIFGTIGEGKVYRIPTFPKQGHVPAITMRINTKEEMEKRTGGKKPYADFLADVKVDKELFGSGTGELEVFFTDGLVPVEAVAKDIIFFGDIRGKLKTINMSMGLKKTSSAPRTSE
ncbi:DUF3108 domain-containing protein [bacterium]|nr:MAG: DUF3108 domain-containing protein [bacterium]